MRFIAAAIILLVLPSAAQAITLQSARDTPRLRGIVDRPPPETRRVPGAVDVHVGTSDRVVHHELREARRNIQRRRESGELSRREARLLRREANLLARLTVRYGANGLSDAERGELVLRASTLRTQSERPAVSPATGVANH